MIRQDKLSSRSQRTADVSDWAVPAMARAVVDGTEAAIVLLVATFRRTEDNMVRKK